MNIVLAGMPGSGKSTIAKVLKRDYKKQVVDTDAEIVKNYGVISEIFAKYGEGHFRQLETEVVKKVSQRNGLVIATGGGCLLREENVEFFKKSSKIVYLRATVDTLFKRVEHSHARPLLEGDKRGNLEKLFAVRAPIYEKAADIVIDTDNLTPEQVAKEIINKIK
jgi:shikimate kinase